MRTHLTIIAQPGVESHSRDLDTPHLARLAETGMALHQRLRSRPAVHNHAAQPITKRGEAKRR